MPSDAVAVVAILALAALTRSTFGFGDALVSMPLLALLLPVEVAAPLVAFLSITISLTMVAQDWRQVHVRTAGWLVASSCAGIPGGLLLLTLADERIVKGVLALVIVGFSTFCLLGRMTFTLRTDRTAWLFGLAAGILGGAYNTNGPPLVIYGTLRRWSAEQFRATLQGYYLPTGVLIALAQGLAGLWTLRVVEYYLLALPLVLGSVLAGRAIHRRLPSRRFASGVHLLLLVVGSMLLVQSLTAGSR